MIVWLSLGLSHSIFLLLVLLSNSYKNAKFDIAVVWMLFLLLPFLDLALSPNVFDVPIVIISDHLPYGLMYGPFLWWYSLQVTGLLKWQLSYVLLHCFPFLILSVLKIALVNPIGFESHFAYNNSMEGNIYASLTITSSVGYSIVVLYLLKAHKRKVVDHFSQLPNTITLQWLRCLAIGFMLLSIWSLFTVLLPIPENLNSSVFSLLAMIYFLGFFSIQQPVVFEREDAKTSPCNKCHTESEHGALKQARSKGHSTKPNEVCHRAKYQRSGLTDDKGQDYLQLLNHYMDEHKPFLDPSLTIEKLSQRLNIPRHYLTQIINEKLNKNFYKYINEYRVNYVKSLIKAADESGLSMLDIAYSSGFNSKSTFNSIFKSMTGLTPSQYKKAQMKNKYSVE